MVSLQQPTYGVMQTNAMAEIDPGPLTLTAHESAYSLGLSHPHTTEPMRIARVQMPSHGRPAEQQLEHTSTGERRERRSVGLAWNDTCTDGTGGSHLGTNDLEGGITFEHLEYSCPFALGFPGALHEEKALGTWMMDLRKHLTSDYRCTQSSARYEGLDNDGFREQATSLPSPDILPSPTRPLISTRRLGGAMSLGRDEYVLPRTPKPVELLRRSYDGAVIGSGYGGNMARACTSRAGENTRTPNGGQCECPDGHAKRTIQVGDKRKWSKEFALYGHGHTFEHEDNTDEMYRLIFGKGQHAGLRNDLGGLLNTHGLLEEDHDALRMKACLKEMRSDLAYCDNVTKTETPGEARIDEAEKSFNVKGKTSMEMSSDNSLIDRSERAVKNLVDAENSAHTRPQPELRRPRLNIASTLPTRTSTTSFRAISIREQRSMDPSYSTQFMMLEAKRCVGLPALTSWATSPQTNSSIGATDVLMRDALMWMIAYNMIASPSESESLPRLLNQSAQLLLNLVAAAISCFHVQLSPMVQRTNARAKQCTETVHCLLEDPG